MTVSEQEPIRHHTYEVTVSLSKEAIDYIGTFRGLMGVSEGFCKKVIENALKEETAEFVLDHDISVLFEVREQIPTYEEPR